MKGNLWTIIIVAALALGCGDAGAPGAGGQGFGGVGGDDGGQAGSAGHVGNGGGGGTPSNTGGTGGELGQAGHGGGCQETAYYLDHDQDDFGDPTTLQLSCDNPSSPNERWVTNADDCYDDNPDARPDLESQFWFQDHRGDGSFDYDCDGSEVFRFPDEGTCPDPPTPGTTGWVLGCIDFQGNQCVEYEPFPDCGRSADWKISAVACYGTLLQNTQQCR